MPVLSSFPAPRESAEYKVLFIVSEYHPDVYFFVPCASRQARVYFFLHILPIDNRQSRRSLSGMPCRDRLRPRQGTLAPLGAIYLRSMSRISLPPAGTYLRCRPAEPVFLGPVKVCG